MYANLSELVEALLGHDRSVRNIVELLDRDGLLASPLQSGFTDRQVRIALINDLGRLGDAAALPTLEKHARLPEFMGGDLVADAAKRAIAAIRGAPGEAAVNPFVETMRARMMQGAEDALNAALCPLRAPSELQAAGLRGLALQRALFALDVEEPLPTTGSDGLAKAAQRVVRVLREIDCDDDVRSQVEDMFANPEVVDCWFDVVSLLRTRGCFHGALEAYDQAVGRFGAEADAMWWWNRGWLLQLWERYGDAIASFRVAQGLNPSYERPRIGLQDVQRLLATLDPARPPLDESHADADALAAQPYEPRRLHRLAGVGGQARTHAFALLSPSNLAIEEHDASGASFDAIAAASLGRKGGARTQGTGGDDVYFISYRWESVPHRRWVFQFAEQLESRGYQVIFDQFEDVDFRRRVGPALHVDRMQGEIPRLVEDLGRATVFMPILTEAYRRCIEPRRTGNPAARVNPAPWSLQVGANDGWVFDEWQVALRLRLAGHLRWQAIWRSGPVVPPPFSRHRVADFRDDERHQALLDLHFPRQATQASVDR